MPRSKRSTRLAVVITAALTAMIPLAASAQGGGGSSGGGSGGSSSGGGGGSGSSASSSVSASSSTSPDPAAVRLAALNAGLNSLDTVVVPEPANLASVLVADPAHPGAVDPKARAATVALGKALFWDMQVGSDGLSCASCHFSAGKDPRSKGQLNPGTLAGSTTFGASGVAGDDGHPNFSTATDLTFADFPFHQGGTDTNNVVSSQGVFSANFAGLTAGPAEVGTPTKDPVFGTTLRKVATRHAPTMINSAFNTQVFWDGKAAPSFNGANPFGPIDPKAGVFVAAGPTVAPTKVPISLDHASLASQAVAVATSAVTFSFAGRPLAQIGRKLFGDAGHPGLVPLALQKVDPTDAVLGAMAGPDKGLKVSYADLVKAAVQPKYWQSSVSVNLGTAAAPANFTQMEANFALIFGLAVQTYESTLVSSHSPFDAFMAGNDKALSADQLTGLLIFINTGQSDPTVSGVAQGSCVACHSGPEFTADAATTMAKTGPISIRAMVDPSGGANKVGTDTAYFDNGFANIGVRPTAEDPGRGGTAAVPNNAKPVPLSFVRQAVAKIAGAPALPACGGTGQPVCPINNRDAVQGAVKIPSLRNAELTGPYFRNGGQATLAQAVEFYHNLDFSKDNVANLDPRIADVKIGKGDIAPLVSFITSLTDPQVRQEIGVFSHPSLTVPNGPGAQDVLGCATGAKPASCTGLIAIGAQGAAGRSDAGVSTFLGLDPQQR